VYHKPKAFYNGPITDSGQSHLTENHASARAEALPQGMEALRAFCTESDFRDWCPNAIALTTDSFFNSLTMPIQKSPSECRLYNHL
jgi:hypothetical protein